MEAREATGVSHTAEWIKVLALEVIDRLGHECFCGATSDSTGNTHLCKKLLVEDVKTIIPNPDICHYLSNLIKDVARIAFFELVRLQAIGKTHFGTLVYSSRSVQRCTPAIQKVIERGKADFLLQKLAEYFGAPNKSNSIHSIKALSFQSNLSQLVSIGLPPTKSLACLESNNANAGDVCLFWHATVREMINVIMNDENQFPDDVRDEILDIIHHRHNNLFVEGGTYYTPLYMAAAYLNPGAFSADITLFKT
ncbi:hypothetical protein ARMGADRAFT_1047002 [Armillaria gallica]|uniref:DUF659 domain-containing protein n=1 Tax=Armillaria gallica TaxID=47427 RepID=A0A2H3DHG4_ARMGA|nr:hypothetical protein ARMGADRAFT_1047002 [Armillaria gallica]